MQNQNCCQCAGGQNRPIPEKLSLAVAYVPWQTFHDTFEPCKGLQMGTIFPELCLPFCGKGGAWK
ncbi:MAG: spore coat associated protein CotJA [Candidatus Limivivens sp.]|nr:spore coat associated protein CotJA [Candidatus Limivivens sp.]